MPGQTVLTRMLCGQILGEALGEVDVGGLRGAIRRIGLRANLSGDRGDEDQRAAGRSTRCGAGALATWTMPMTLTFITRGQSDGWRCVKGNPNLPDPIAAAWTTWSMSPSTSRVAARAASTA